MSNKASRYKEKPTDQPTKRTRRQKISSGEGFDGKEKFQPQRVEQVKRRPIEAKTLKQAHYLEMLQDPNIRIIIATGLAGTGKTYIPSAQAADELREHLIENIIVARPYVTTGKSSGSKPGTSLQKLLPFVRTMLDTMKSRLGKQVFEISLDDGIQGVIEVQELESIRGRSFDQKSWLIVDEAQQSTPEEMLSIITRVSDNCKLVLCGDLRQRDIAGKSGLKWFMDFAERHCIPGIGIVDFNEIDDIVRGGIVKGIAAGLLEDESTGKWTPQSN